MKKIVKFIFFKSLYLINIIIFLPLFFIILLISFFKKIRFYEINSFLGAIGVNIKIYLCRKRRHLYRNEINLFFIKNYFKIFVLKKNISNTFLLSIISENIMYVTPKNIYLFLLYNFIVEKIYNIIVLFNLKKFLINIKSYHGYFRENEEEVEGFRKAKDMLIKIKKNDLYKCDHEFETLNKVMDIKPDQKIITFYNRDRAYKKYQLPHMDLSYHDFRNFSVQDYELCIKHLIKKDFFTIRMGNITERKMQLDNKNFFDYSKSNRVSPMMDIYLIYKSKFFIGSEGGLDKVANLFRKPIVLVNIQFRSIQRKRNGLDHQKMKLIPNVSKQKMLELTGEDIFFIPQKYFNLETNKYLTFSEMINSKVGLYILDDQFKKSKIKVVNNTPEEIMNVAEEMDLFLDGKLEFSNEDLKLQKIFWTKFNNEFSYSKNYKISPFFLRNNLNLLN